MTEEYSAHLIREALTAKQTSTDYRAEAVIAGLDDTSRPFRLILRGKEVGRVREVLSAALASHEAAKREVEHGGKPQ